MICQSFVDLFMSKLLFGRMFIRIDACLSLTWLSLGLFLVGFGWHLGFLCLFASLLLCLCLVVVFPVGGWAVRALSPIGFCSLAWLRALADCWTPCVLQLAVAWWFSLAFFPPGPSGFLLVVLATVSWAFVPCC